MDLIGEQQIVMTCEKRACYYTMQHMYVLLSNLNLLLLTLPMCVPEYLFFKLLWDIFRSYFYASEMTLKNNSVTQGACV